MLKGRPDGIAVASLAHKGVHTHDHGDEDEHTHEDADDHVHTHEDAHAHAHDHEDEDEDDHGDEPRNGEDRGFFGGAPLERLFLPENSVNGFRMLQDVAR